MKTYKIKSERADVNAVGGKSTVVWLARADDPNSALRLVGGSNREILDHGAHLDAEAERLGIRDGDAQTM
ncbi:hypothetical protein [Marivita sp.]|uniref:hypothetical protein n=1 Tax=Marivita sp. TaxID=2003365 RepID=UPI003F70582B